MAPPPRKGAAALAARTTTSPRPLHGPHLHSLCRRFGFLAFVVLVFVVVVGSHSAFSSRRGAIAALARSRRGDRVASTLASSEVLGLRRRRRGATHGRSVTLPGPGAHVPAASRLAQGLAQLQQPRLLRSTDDDSAPSSRVAALIGHPCAVDQRRRSQGGTVADSSLSCLYYPAPTRAGVQCCCRFASPGSSSNTDPLAADPRGTPVNGSASVILMATPLGSNDKLQQQLARSNGAVPVPPLFTCLPSLVIVGAQKSGSTALFSHLLAHPQVRPALRKELHYFDRYTTPFIDWYLARFPEWPDERGGGACGNGGNSGGGGSVNCAGAGAGPAAADEERLGAAWAALRAAGVPESPLERTRFYYAATHVAMDASPSYMLGVSTAARIRALLPHATGIAILREPVARAYSEWQMKLRRVEAQIVVEEEAGFAVIAGGLRACFAGVVNGSLPLPSTDTLAAYDAAVAARQRNPAAVRRGGPTSSGSSSTSSSSVSDPSDAYLADGLSRCLVSVFTSRYGVEGERKVSLAIHAPGGFPAPPPLATRCILGVLLASIGHTDLGTTLPTVDIAVAAAAGLDAGALAILPALRSCLAPAGQAGKVRRETIGPFRDIAVGEMAALARCSVPVDLTEGAPLPLPADLGGVSPVVRLLVQTWKSAAGMMMGGVAEGGREGTGTGTPDGGEDTTAGGAEDGGTTGSTNSLDRVNDPRGKMSRQKGMIVEDGKITCWPVGATSNIVADFLYRGMYLRQLQRLAAAFGTVSGGRWGGGGVRVKPVMPLWRM